MRVILKHELNRVKNGFAARSPELRLVAHGHSDELARRNLERTALLFLKPLERQGVLEEELSRLNLRVEDEAEELTVVVGD